MTPSNVKNDQNKNKVNLTDKLSEDIQQNKIYVDLIGTYVIRRKGKKENIYLKGFTMIDPVTG